jgi:hypothetical protein
MQSQYQEIPQSLIYEIMDGQPLYYRGIGALRPWIKILKF